MSDRLKRKSRPGSVDMINGVPITEGCGDVFKDVGVKPATIGDLVDFRDNAGIKWRGAVLDIRRGIQASGGWINLYDIPEAQAWAFVACIGWPHTTPVKLEALEVVHSQWWHR